MQEKESTIQIAMPKDLMDTIIRIGLIVVLAVMCVRIFAPFANLMLWALILAIALYPMHQSLAKRLGGQQGRAATLVVVAGLLLIGGPTVMLGGSFASQVKNLMTFQMRQTINTKMRVGLVGGIFLGLVELQIITKHTFHLKKQGNL